MSLERRHSRTLSQPCEVMGSLRAVGVWARRSRPSLSARRARWIAAPVARYFTTQAVQRAAAAWAPSLRSALPVDPRFPLVPDTIMPPVRGRARHERAGPGGQAEPVQRCQDRELPDGIANGLAEVGESVHNRSGVSADALLTSSRAIMAPASGLGRCQSFAGPLRSAATCCRSPRQRSGFQLAPVPMGLAGLFGWKAWRIPCARGAFVISRAGVRIPPPAPILPTLVSSRSITLPTSFAPCALRAGRWRCAP